MDSKGGRHHQGDNCQTYAKQRKVDPLLACEESDETRIANTHKNSRGQAMHHAEGGTGGANGVVEM